MKTLTLLLSLASVAIGSAYTSKATIVLVHGAFADGSSWAKVIPILQGDGYTVIAVQNPLTSLADDVATTKRVIEAQKGPVVVVGHSYGAAVTTGAAAGNANVEALVYIAAFAPDANEPVTAYGDKYPSPLNSALRTDQAGYVTVDPAQFHEVFAKDASEAEARIAAATQKPILAKAFGDSVGQAAWKSVPAWYLVTLDDHAIPPDLQRFYAKRIGATTTEIKSSHAPFLSHPKEVAKVIEAAATASSVRATR